MKLSAQNLLKGTVLKIVPGSVNSEVTLELAGAPRWCRSSARRPWPTLASRKAGRPTRSSRRQM